MWLHTLVGPWCVYVALFGRRLIIKKNFDNIKMHGMWKLHLSCCARDSGLRSSLYTHRVRFVWNIGAQKKPKFDHENILQKKSKPRPGEGEIMLRTLHSYRIIPTSIIVINKKSFIRLLVCHGSDSSKFGTAKISLQRSISGPTSTSRMPDLLSVLQVPNLFAQAKTTSGVNSHRGLSEQPTFTAFFLQFS
jgi:hypothetical protein